MSFWEVALIGIGLSMDAFAVSLCKGICLKKMSWLKAVLAGLYFGGFQALMPTIGYFVGSRFYEYIERYDHWIAFILLLIIGTNMIRESFGKDEEADADFSWRSMLPLAVATSIDALAAGVSLAMTGTGIAVSAIVIGVTAFVISFAGVYIGGLIGGRLAKKADMAGGIVLILLGLKILLTSL